MKKILTAKIYLNRKELAILNNVIMREQINENVLCILKKNQSNEIEIGYINIEKPLANLIKSFVKICEAPETTLDQVKNFIIENQELNKLSAKYRYCIDLKGSYQAFTANNNNTINDIDTRYQIMQENQKNNKSNFDISKEITNLKIEIKNRYILWNNAFSINRTYRKCNEDKSIIAFSHRIDGWSNPVYQLTPNFSIEIKTNFGYGNASYFYNKLKYKNIEITPFSEWIEYEIAEFSEIIRYTKKYKLYNEYWLDAMEFSKDACNLSLTSEPKFVEKYIINECEKMVKGLEYIFSNDHFSFKDIEKKKYKVDKKGHLLVEFRGEKISGALDFISKILEFDNIVSVRDFITRIETCNHNIQPMLVKESKLLKAEINSSIEEIKNFKPTYDTIIDANNSYHKKKLEFKKEIITKNQLNPLQIASIEIDKIFIEKFPEYILFMEEYKRITESFRLMNEQLQNLTTVYENIETYNNKILNYFG